MPFVGEQLNIPMTVTAEWLFAHTEMRRSRCFIKGKFFYTREKEDFPNGPIEKYRFLGKNVCSYTFRIVRVA